MIKRLNGRLVHYSVGRKGKRNQTGGTTRRDDRDSTMLPIRATRRRGRRECQSKERRDVRVVYTLVRDGRLSLREFWGGRREDEIERSGRRFNEGQKKEG